MKRFITLFIALCTVFSLSASSYAKVDLSVFQNDPVHKAVIDDTDDTYRIDCASGTVFYGTSDTLGKVGFTYAVSTSADDADIILLEIVFSGPDRPSPEKVIIRTDNAQYTFPRGITGFDESSEIVTIGIAVTDETVSMIKELAESRYPVKMRIETSSSGDDIVPDIDGNARTILTALYDDYIAAGGLDQDFTAVNKENNVEIKVIEYTGTDS